MPKVPGQRPARDPAVSGGAAWVSLALSACVSCVSLQRFEIFAHRRSTPVSSSSGRTLGEHRQDVEVRVTADVLGRLYCRVEELEGETRQQC